LRKKRYLGILGASSFLLRCPAEVSKIYEQLRRSKRLEGPKKRTTGQRDVELLEVGYWRMLLKDLV